jgi:hypothetical protein
VKQGKMNSGVEKPYDRQKTVFKDWREDTEQKIEQSFNHDASYWRVPQFIKDLKQQDEVADIVKENYAVLKAIFTYYAGRSSFPYLGNLEFL